MGFRWFYILVLTLNAVLLSIDFGANAGTYMNAAGVAACLFGLALTELTNAE